MASRLMGRQERSEQSLVEPNEFLITDPRGSLTPAQMVEQKLQALLQPGQAGQSSCQQGGSESSEPSLVRGRHPTYSSRV